MTSSERGFTLIELLVVIAIIGILASVVLASLGTARNKSKDTKTISQLKQMIPQAQLYTGANTQVYWALTTTITSCTGATCTLFNETDTTKHSLYQLATTLSPGVRYYSVEAKSPSEGGRWAFAVALTKGSACVDYTGTLTTNTTPLSSNGEMHTRYPNISAGSATPYLCS